MANPPVQSNVAKARPTTREKRDDSIMNTNSSCIVSKRSVEKLYHNDDHGFLRYFVKKFQRRSPLINRGYWLRMRAIEHVVRQFLQEPKGKRKLVVNLGCGYDTMPLKFLAQEKELCRTATFIDIDYRQLILKKCEVVANTEKLKDVIPDMELLKDPKEVVLRSEKYVALACDLQKIQDLEQAMRHVVNPQDEDVSVLYIAEVSMTYMDAAAADTLIKWTSSFIPGQFCLLEQFLPDGPDHPFASTMLKHFVKLQSRLKSAEDYPLLQDQHDRFTREGWPHVKVRSLWNLWSDDGFLTVEERRGLDDIEPFDEWEEFALFGSHYFLLLARSDGSTQDIAHPSVKAAISSPEADQNNGIEKTIHAVFVEHPKGLGLRRFGASLQESSTIVAIHGGHGERSRLQSGDTFGKLRHGDDATQDTSGIITFPRTEIMCHTITAIVNTGNREHLLVGGRGSPAHSSPECYLRKNQTWKRVDSLPHGLYRHCAVAVADFASDASGSIGVLIFGGKTDAGTLMREVLFWNSEKQWRKVRVTGEQPCPRSGAAMLATGAGYGFLTGGISEDGRVLSDLWKWRLSIKGGSEAELTITFTNFTTDIKHGDTEGVFGRYGAKLVRSPWGILLFGGVGVDMLGLKDEILVIKGDWSLSRLQVNFTVPRPLLVGSDVVEIDDGEVLLVGGGAVCFSFGTFWNEGSYTVRTTLEANVPSWRLLTPAVKSAQEVPMNSKPFLEDKDRKKEQLRRPREAKKITRKVIGSAEDFQAIMSKGRPVILEGLDIGQCTALWDLPYLKKKVGEDRKVVIHSSPSPNMSFLSKNFSYETISFGQFIDRVEAGAQKYLRALSSERPAEHATHLEQDFPSIANDFQLPHELAFVKANSHSSPLRISGPVAMWLHYDVMANVLCQIRGHKKLMLYPPREVEKLGFPAGASSSSINVFDHEAVQDSGLGSVQAHEANLKPGDVLFIPALWAHAAQPTEGYSIAVNVFFKNLDAGYAAGKDVYGNRDLQGYEQGRKDLGKMTRAFQQLPSEVGKFYLTRLAMELQALASQWGEGGGEQ